MADCCTTLPNAFDDLAQEIQDVVDAGWWFYIARLREILQLPPGAFIELPAGQFVPTLSDLLARIATPLDAGFGEWRWYNYDQPNKTALTLPQAPTPSKTRVCLNNVEMATPRDYSISGTVLTFVVPLQERDLVWVKSYGP